jgi:hypothetical protein
LKGLNEANILVFFEKEDFRSTISAITHFQNYSCGVEVKIKSPGKFLEATLKGVAFSLKGCQKKITKFIKNSFKNEKLEI